MHKRSFLGLAVASVVAVAGCSVSKADSGSNGSSTGPVVVGLALAESGFMSAFDIPVMHGAEIAVDDLNAKGGVLGRKIKLVVSDTHTDIAQGTAAAQEVISKGAAMMITSCDYDFGGPGARVAQQKGLVSFSCAASPKFGVQAIGDLAHSISSGTPTEGAVMAQYAYQNLNARTAYLLEDTGLEYSKAFCQYFAESFQHWGGTVVGSDSFANTDISIAAQITRLNGSAKKPDVIAYCSYPPGGAAGLRQLRGAGIGTTVVTDTSFDGAYWLDAVPKLTNFYYPTSGSIFGDDPLPRWQEFVTKYTAKAGSPPSNASYPGSGYSIIEGWAAAVEQAGTFDSRKVEQVLNSWKDKDLLNGPTTYSQTQHMALGRAMAVLEIKDGKNGFVTRFAPQFVPKPNVY
jgi:branched-chain amino acid transport system substrate-binding protein